MPRFVDTTKVNQGRITIPEAIRNMYSIDEGCLIDWFENKDSIIIKKHGEKENDSG